MSPQQPVYHPSEWMDGSDDALGPIGDIRDAVIQLDAGDWKGGAESATQRCPRHRPSSPWVGLVA